jgi:hypothetical protein
VEQWGRSRSNLRQKEKEGGTRRAGAAVVVRVTIPNRRNVVKLKRKHAQEKGKLGSFPTQLIILLFHLTSLH